MASIRIPPPASDDNKPLLKNKSAEEVLCDRCERPMFRMRAVYWCHHCGYKTDCCGS